jgi:predicted alpha/beta-hydrolase family hydrolase
MGGRIGCHVAAASQNPPAALVCLGYPLVGQGGKMRDEILLELKTPILFVQGTRDALCPLEKLEALLPKLLRVRVQRLKARGETEDAVDEGIVRAMREFLEAHA